jgi:hypothetical protein
MERIKVILEFHRVATLKTPKAIVNIGDIKDYQQFEDGSIKFTLEFNPNLPYKIRDMVEKNPKMLGIKSVVREAVALKMDE